MARPKKTNVQIRQERARTTWTRFRLPIEQHWIKWPDEYPDTDLGPLADVPGRLTVRLGRMVQDRENAALIILWESEDALSAFQASPRCAPVLRCLGYEDASPSHFVSLQWESGFSLGDGHWRDELYGRMTLSILTVQGPREVGNRVLHAAFRDFVPKGCDDLLGPPGWSSQAFTWIVGIDGGGSPGGAVCYHFFRWNGIRSSTEREEVAVREPGVRESWEEVVAKATPPVVAWKQERWDIEVAPCHVSPAESGEEFKEGE